jgi:pimeloyl-ACP methyl ester carboxylesterase
MATFVLIHGAWHGGWCWERVVPLLEAKGHTVLAPDLPGMGSDTTPLAEVSVASWARFTADLVSRQAENVVLVGHSRGGIVISQAAELAPDRIASLVYLTAFLLPNGQTLMGMLDEARNEREQGAEGAIVVSDDATTCTVRPEDVAPIFYNTAEPYWVVRASAHLVPEPTASFATPVQVTEERFGRVPRIYVECTEDRAIPIGTQRRMHAGLPCTKVLSLETDHSPFYSAPAELVALLDGVALSLA